MDGLSAGASVIAIASLAIQLAENARKLYNFWQAIDEAPASIRGITTDLKFLSSVLTDVAAHDQKYGPNDTTTTVLESCVDHVGKMLSITNKLASGMTSNSFRTRKWSAVKAAFKEEKILKFHGLLEQTKTTLILARQSLTHQHLTTCFEDQSRLMISLTQQISSLQLEETQIQTSKVMNLSQDSDVNEHLETLRSEICRMVSTISNPFMAAAFQKSMNLALKQISESTVQKPSAATFQTLTSSRKPTHGHLPHSRDSYPEFLWVSDEGVLPTENTAGYPLERLGRGTNPRKRKLQRESSTETSNLFGTVFFSTKTFLVRPTTTCDDSKLESHDDYQEESEVRFSMHPGQWLLRLGLRYGLRVSLSRSSREWKHTIQTFRPVPDDSLIFELCRTGNIDGVRLLFSRKEASIWDTDSRGYTLLHIGAESSQFDVCKMLVANGADVDQHTNSKIKDGMLTIMYEERQESCLIIAIRNLLRGSSSKYPSTGAWIEAFRIFLATSVPEDKDDMCWRVIYYLTWECGSLQSSSREVNLWLVQTLMPSLKGLPYEYRVSLLGAAICKDDSILVDFILRACDNLLNDRRFGLAFCLICRAYGAAETFFRRGARLHTSIIPSFFMTDPLPSTQDLKLWETPTSIALYSSLSFHKWRNILVSEGIDLEAFAEEEIQLPRLRGDEWEDGTFLDILQFEYTPSDKFTTPKLYPKCGIDLFYRGSGAGVEVAWQHLLSKVKSRKPRVHGNLRSSVIDFSNEGDYSKSGVAEDGSPQSDVTAGSDCDSNGNELEFIPDGKYVCVGCWHKFRGASDAETIVEEGYSPSRSSSAGHDLASSSSEEEEEEEDDESDEESSPFLLRI